MQITVNYQNEKKNDHRHIRNKIEHMLKEDTNSMAIYQFNLISLSMFIISFQCVVNLIAILHIHYKTENLLFIPVVGLNQRDQVHSRYKQKCL